MALIDSLLSAMVRANGDALVMHVGERPYVVAPSGPIDLSKHGLNLSGMTGMLAQLLPLDTQNILEEIGAVEHPLPSFAGDAFTLVAARGGDDIWIEIRRRRVAPLATATRGYEPAPAPKPVTALEPAAALKLPAAPPVPPMPQAPPVAAVASEPVVAFVPETSPKVVPVTDSVSTVPTSPEFETDDADAVYVLDAASIGDSEHEMAQVVARAPHPATALVPAESHALAEPLPRLDAAALSDEPVARPPASDARAVDAPVAAPALAEMPAAEPPAPPEPMARAGVAPPPAEPAVELMQPTAPAVDAPAASEAVEYHEIAEAAEPVEDAIDDLSDVALEEEPALVEASASAEESSARGAAPSSASSSLSAPPTAGGPPPQTPEPVMPMTRTVRIEVPSHGAAGKDSGIDRVLKQAAALGASMVMLSSQTRPYVRIEGELRALEGAMPMSGLDVERAIADLLPDGAPQAGDHRPLEWVADLAGIGPIKCSSFRDHRGAGAVIHFAAARAVTAEQIGLSADLQALATESDGLVLVAGPRSSGKSSLVSAIVELVNQRRADYVITLERDVRFVHENQSAFISQREAPAESGALMASVRAALDERPDVLVIEDLEASAVAPLLIEAADRGVLVVVSLTAASTGDAVQWLLESAPMDQRGRLAAALARAFRGAVAQVMLRKASGGRMVVRELMLGTAPVARLIAENRIAELSGAVDEGRDHGMVSLTDALVAAVQHGHLDVREAYRKTPDRPRLLAGLRRTGLDTSIVERLA